MPIPLAIAGGIAAASVAGTGIAAAAGAGKNRRSANFFYDPSGKRGTGHNANAANWGGNPEGLQQYTSALDQERNRVDARQGEQANYGYASQSRGASMQARGQQQEVAGLMMNRATGATPSIAQQQGALDMQRATAAQASQAAGARGAAGLALAGQTAANNTANAQATITNNTQVAAANERLQAENAAMGAYSNIRGGDTATQAQDAQQAQYQANLNAQQRAQNDQMSMGYAQLGAGANQAQMNAKMQEQGILAGSYNQSEALNQQTAQANANREGSWIDKLIPSDSNMKNVGSMDSIMSLAQGGKGPSSGGSTGGGDAFSEAGKGGGGMNVGGIMSLASMFSDTRTKQAALLEKGRAQGAAMAQRGADPADVAQIRYGSWSGNAAPSALDDRARQNEVGPNTVGKAALNSAIEAQLARDHRANPQKTQDQAILASGGRGAPAQADSNPDQVIRDDAARAQWERSFGSVQGAEDDARTADNLKEAQKIREGFGQGPDGKEKEVPWYMTPVPSGFFDSDEKKKDAGPDVVPLADDPHRGRLQMDGERAFYKSDDEDDGRPSLVSMSAPIPLASGGAKAKSAKAAPSKRREMTPDELSAEADRMMASLKSDHESRMARGPSVARPDDGPVADANRAMRGEPYTYKPEYTPPNEEKGQPHFGFMAQNLEKSPVTKVAVEKGPDGMRRVDRDRLLQVVAAGVSDLQRQQDETRLALKPGGRKGRRG